MNSLFKKIAYRISILFLAVIVVSTVVSVVYLNRSYVENTRRELQMQAKVYEELLGGGDISRYADAEDEISGVRTTIIEPSGKVILDTEADVSELENHLGRPEIRQALSNGTGTNIRYSDTLGKELMYVALYSQELELFIRVALPLEGMSVFARGFWLPLVIVLTVSFLLCLAISLLVSRSVVKPIVTLKQYTRSIAKGQYDDIKALKTGDEIEALSTSFEGMALALKRNISDITEKSTRLQAVFKAVPGGIIAIDNEGFVIMANPAATDMFSISSASEGKHYLEAVKHPMLEAVIKEALSTRNVVEKEITLQRGLSEVYLQVFAVSVTNDGEDYGVILLAQDITRVRKLESMRSDFAANVSHELKTPLTVIRGFIETLKDPDMPRQDFERFLDIIGLESERLSRLIDDVLLLSEIEHAQVSPAAVIDIRGPITEAAQLLETKAKEKGIVFTLDICEEKVMAAADMDRIKQMVINLADNAIKYTPDGGSVSVSVYRDSGRGVISVKDTGIGIPKENLPRLFERFYRVDKSRSRSLGGTGLGLAIVKHIVSLLGGHITVRSEPGAGSRFDIYLPNPGK